MLRFFSSSDIEFRLHPHRLRRERPAQKKRTTKRNSVNPRNERAHARSSPASRRRSRNNTRHESGERGNRRGSESGRPEALLHGHPRIPGEREQSPDRAR